MIRGLEALVDFLGFERGFQEALVESETCFFLGVSACHVFLQQLSDGRCSLSTTSLSRHGDSAVFSNSTVPRGLGRLMDC